MPLRARRDGWTPERQRRFIALLAETRCPARAARAVGLSRESAYRLRGRPGGESFAAAWNAALRSRRPEPAGPTARQRAFEGVLVPVTYRGRKVGERRKYDGRLAALLMRHFYAARAERKRSEALARMTKLMVRPSTGTLAIKLWRQARRSYFGLKCFCRRQVHLDFRCGGAFKPRAPVRNLPAASGRRRQSKIDLQQPHPYAAAD